MGEAKKRGDFESRKRQSIQNSEYEAAKRKVEQADKDSLQAQGGTSAKRSKLSLSLAISAMLAISSLNRGL